MKLKPFATTGINYEPIHWLLVSHFQADGTAEYKYHAPSQYTNRKYHLQIIINQEGEFQHMTMC